MPTILKEFILAEGSVGPNLEQLEFADVVAERLATGEFHVPATGTIPRRCVDERPGGEGFDPNAAGGTETLYVADDLTDQFWTKGASTSEGFRTILTMLADEGKPVGGHTDGHAHGEASGCGANDKLALIYSLIARRGDELRALAKGLGVTVDDDTHELIVRRAGERTDFSSGAQLLDSLKEIGGEESVEHLIGEHEGVVAVVNLRPNTTLDREALSAAIPGAQAFNIDAWSFKDAAREAIPSPDVSADQKAAAMVYYNLATGGVLFGKDMRIVVVQ